MTKENENKQNKSKVKKIVDITATTLVSVIFVIVLVTCLGIMVQVFSGKKPSFFGYRFYYILTDSMEPTYKVGEVVLSKLLEKDEEKEKIQIGDVITFKATDPRLQGQVITHRVIEGPYRLNNKMYVKTKGDNPNTGVDNPIEINLIEAKTIGKSKLLSVVYKVFSNTTGMIMLIVIPFLLLLSSLIYRLIFQIKKPIKKAKDEEPNLITKEYKDKVIDDFLRDEELKRKTIEEYIANNAKEKEPSTTELENNIEE